MVGGGGSLLNESYSGRTTAEDDRAVSETLHDVGALSSPFGLAGGAVGYAVDGREGMRNGAAIGNVAHLGHGLARFGTARLGPGTSRALSADPTVTTAASNVEYAATTLSRGTSTIVAHGAPGLIQNASGAVVPISDLAPTINGSSAGRVVLFACDIGQDAQAVQGLANATGRAIRAFTTPVSAGNVTTLNGVTHGKQLAQYIEKLPQYLSPNLYLSPNVVAPGAALASGAIR